MDKTPLVSVNIVTYNGLRWLERCFSSLFAQTYGNIEIIALDNASVDGSKEWLKKTAQEHTNLKVIENPTNLGFAAAHNIGISQANGKYVCLLNQDIVMDENFVQNVVIEFEKQDEKIAAIQGKLFRLGSNFDKTDILDSCGLEMLKNRRIISRGQGEKDNGQYNNMRVIFGVDGALPVYSKKALEDIKIPIGKNKFEYFDEDFFMYKEDVDLAWRFILFGWQSIFVPSAKAWHARGAGESAAKNMMAVIRERRKIPSWSKFYSWKNQRLMQIKNELPVLFLKDLPVILIKEILSIGYIILFETKNSKSFFVLLKQLPNAIHKRSYIMTHKRIKNSQDISFWFKS